MRIIAGTKARMTLLPPRGLTTRPITDRVKESLFSILGNRLADHCIADLFCGTGSLGLEALSRGAQHAIFVDHDRDAIKRLKKNIDKLAFSDKSTIIQTDLINRAVPSLCVPDPTGQMDEHVSCDLVFLDPPYRYSQQTAPDSILGRLLGQIGPQLADRAWVVVRHPRRTDLLEAYEDLHLHDRREYGSMALSFLEKISAPRPSQ